MKHDRLVAFALSSAFVAVAACSTDNGAPVFGPTFGPNDKDGAASSSGSSSGASSGSSSGDDGGGSSSGSSGSTGDGGGDANVTPCTAGAVAVLAGGDASLSGAVQTNGGAWSGSTISGGSALSRPSLVAFGAGFLGATHAGSVVQSTRYTTAWSAATSFGVANVKGPPTLAVAGTNAHVVYSAGAGMVRELTHGIFDGNAWNAADATVGTKPNHSFGTLGAGLAGAGNTVAFMENGTDYNLYTRVYDGGWSPATQVANATSIGADTTAFPVITEGAGPYDLVAIYSAKTTRRLSWAARDSQSKLWNNGGVVHDFALTDEPFAAARVSALTYLVAFRGQDGNGYVARGTLAAGGTFTWTAAQPVAGAGNVAVDATPAVAKGVCGDDAIVVYASASQVKATRLRGTSWTAPESVTGASGARVAVATR